MTRRRSVQARIRDLARMVETARWHLGEQMPVRHSTVENEIQRLRVIEERLFDLAWAIESGQVKP